jgi:hypothetical protein
MPPTPTIVVSDSSNFHILLPPGASVQSTQDRPPSPLDSPAVSVASLPIPITDAATQAAGCQPVHVYRRLMPTWSFWIRQELIQSMEKEMPLLEAIQVCSLREPLPLFLACLVFPRKSALKRSGGLPAQRNCRRPWLDIYFAQSSLLGTHTFFMIFLPLFWWFGMAEIGRGCVSRGHLQGITFRAPPAGYCTTSPWASMQPRSSRSSTSRLDLHAVAQAQSPSTGHALRPAPILAARRSSDSLVPLSRVWLPLDSFRQFGLVRYPYLGRLHPRAHITRRIALFLAEHFCYGQGLPGIVGMVVLTIYASTVIWGRVHCGMHSIVGPSMLISCLRTQLLKTLAQIVFAGRHSAPPFGLYSPSHSPA